MRERTTRENSRGRESPPSFAPDNSSSDVSFLEKGSRKDDRPAGTPEQPNEC